MAFTLRYAVAADKPAVKTLWTACFPGEPAFTDYFFEELYVPDNALLCVGEDGAPAAMLHMLPYTMVWLGREVPVSYVYGVGTHPDYRRRGLAADLMDQALFEMHLRGVLFSVLIPQEEWLFDFYRPFGYAAVFTKSERAYTFAGTARPAGGADIPLLQALYERHLKGHAHLLRTEEHWRSILKECELSGGRVLLDGEEGYAVFAGDPAERPAECFGPGARVDGAVLPFGCLRVVEAGRVSALLRHEGQPVPACVLDDPYAPWNVNALAEPDGKLTPGTPLSAGELAELVFKNMEPYMQLMHN